jgi:sporulation protein YlmC with PRC-barrel domain
MRTKLSLLTAVAAAALLTTDGGLIAARAAQPTLVAANTADTVDAKNLVGQTVVDAEGKTLGKVDSVLVDADGKVKYLIVGVGGFLGIGEKDVALRWDDLQTKTGDKLVANVTKDQLTTMPAYRYGDASRRGTVYAYDQDLKTNPYLADNRGATAANNVAVPPDAAISTKDLIGRSVVDPQGNSVGKIDSALIDDSGKVKYLIVGVGGFLGIGEKDVALRWDDLQQKDADKLVSSMTKDQLKAMPTYRYSDAKRRGTVYPYREDLTTNPYLAEGVAPTNNGMANNGTMASNNAATTGGTAAVDATNLVGRTVVDSQGKSLGKVDSVLVDDGGTVKYIVVGVGGFLGIGEKNVALHWSDLQTKNGDQLVANVTKDQLTSLPGYRYGDASRRGKVYPWREELTANPYLAENQSNAPAPSSTTASNQVPPYAGANSFTQAQARSRIENHGFTAVSDLKKDDEGIWRGTAVVNGKTVNVALDYKGNVVVQ